MFAGEIRRFFGDLRINEELQRLLASMTVELSAQVRFIPHDEQLRTVVAKKKVRVKRGRRARDRGCEDGTSQEREAGDAGVASQRDDEISDNPGGSQPG